MNDKLAAFRDTALDEGIPGKVVSLLVSTARPCVTLGPRIDGPLAGVFGGHPPVPDGLEIPPLPFVAAVDCARIPDEATDLPLPRTGTLLFFGGPDGRCAASLVPAGTPVTERPGHPKVYPRRELRLSLDMSIDQEAADFDLETDPEGELYDLLDDVSWVLAAGGPLRLGGHPPYFNYHPADAVRSRARGHDPEAPLDWTVLASWSDGDGDIEGLDHGIVHWVLPQEDLAAARFDRLQGSWDMP